MTNCDTFSVGESGAVKQNKVRKMLMSNNSFHSGEAGQVPLRLRRMRIALEIATDKDKGADSGYVIPPKIPSPLGGEGEG